MKTFVSTMLMISNIAYAGSFKVKEPVERSQKILIPVKSLSCVKGPFGMQALKVVLPQPVGSPEQKGILQSQMDNEGDCNSTIQNMLKFGNELPFDLEILNRSVVRSKEYGSYGCEGAQHEVVTVKVGRFVTRESVIATEAELDCPSGYYPPHVGSRDGVIYVLHEDGIPTKSEF